MANNNRPWIDTFKRWRYRVIEEQKGKRSFSVLYRRTVKNFINFKPKSITMDNLNLKQKVKDQVVDTRQKQEEHQVKFVGRIKPKKGHTLFKYNVKSKEIDFAKFQQIDVDFLEAKNGNLSAKKKVIMEDDCIYISCLNKKNVKKILKREYGILVV